MPAVPDVGALRDIGLAAGLDALEVAQAKGFVEGLEHGLEAPIAQGGTNVSGGQRQRLAIARVLVHRPEIYLFDDSFSALDVATDARLRAALRGPTRDAAVVIVAQRVSTIIGADQILVLDHGRITARGTHEELLAPSDTYREIVESQISAEEPAIGSWVMTIRSKGGRWGLNVTRSATHFRSHDRWYGERTRRPWTPRRSPGRILRSRPEARTCRRRYGQSGCSAGDTAAQPWALWVADSDVPPEHAACTPLPQVSPDDEAGAEPMDQNHREAHCGFCLRLSDVDDRAVGPSVALLVVPKSPQHCVQGFAGRDLLRVEASHAPARDGVPDVGDDGAQRAFGGVW